jgi:hypothetical protein
MPAPQEQGKPFRITTVNETETSLTLRVDHEEKGVIFTYTPANNKVEFEIVGQEATKPPEHPAITIEGNPAFKHKLEKAITHSGLPTIPTPRTKMESCSTTLWQVETRQKSFMASPSLTPECSFTSPDRIVQRLQETQGNSRDNQSREYVERPYAATNCMCGFGRRIRVTL